MKEIKTTKIEKVIAKPIEYIDKEVEVIMYESEDGHKFKDKKSCEVYEEMQLFYSKIKVLELMYYDFLPESGKLCYIESREDFDKLYKLMGTTYREYRSRIDYRDVVFPQWVIFQRGDGGDYADSHYYYFEDQIREMIGSTLEVLGYMNHKGEVMP
ncbi:MAG: hypothetical protein AB7V16_07045 [Vulcanibacillus sp.]